MAGDHDRASQGDPAQHPQCGGGNSHAAMTDRVAEHSRIRPAVQADGARATAKGVQGVRMQAKRKNQRAVSRVLGR